MRMVPIFQAQLIPLVVSRWVNRHGRHHIFEPVIVTLSHPNLVDMLDRLRWPEE